MPTFRIKNLRYWLGLTSVAITITIVLGLFLKVDNTNLMIGFDDVTPRLSMPIVKNDPFAHLAAGNTPQPHRGIEFRKWLQATVRVGVTGATGSGTIVYYDDNTGWAYVQTCGHLWGGMQTNMSGEQGKRLNKKCRVTVWYKNDLKLDRPINYDAEVLYYNNAGNGRGGPGSGHDVALIRFKPDWKPNYFPIAPDEFEFDNNMRLHSMGCDHSTETAHYDVRLIGFSGKDFRHLVTTENSPRPGRSGGGLLSDEYYVGTCWGTSDTSGKGNGFFTPLETIKFYNKQNGYGWLNEMGNSLARRIPIIDRNNPQGRYPRNYIPIPGGR